MNGELEIQWKQSDMVEVTLNEPDDFLKVRETLTRIGVASRKEKKIYQSCHILHKQGKYTYPVCEVCDRIDISSSLFLMLHLYVLMFHELLKNHLVHSM